MNYIYKNFNLCSKFTQPSPMRVQAGVTATTKALPPINAVCATLLSFSVCCAHYELTCAVPINIS